MKKIITTFFLIFISLNSYAITDQERQGSINNQNILLQRQNQFEQNDAREKELRNIEKQRQKIEKEELEERDELEKEVGKIVQDFRSIQCFRINEINFSDNQIISKFHQKKLTKNYVGKCLDLNRIAELRKEIANYLIEEGYITSRVEVPAQALSDGILIFNIIEGNLEDLTFNQDKFFDKTQKFTAFGFVEKDRVLNLRKIENGLDQINRLRSNNAAIKVLPGSQKEASVIALENNPHHRSRISAAYDNNGHKLTGDKRATIGFAQDNLFWLNDNFSISRTSNDVEKSRKNNGGSDSLNSSFSVPFSWYNLTLNYSKSSYFFWGGEVSRFKSSGETSARSVSLDRILVKEKKFKLASNFSLMSRYNQSFIDDVKQDSQSRKAAIFSAGLSSTFFFNNASLFLKPSYSKSLKILDAFKDNPNLSSTSAHAQFDMFKFYGNYMQKFAIFSTPLSYNLTFDSQISKQRLYGNDHFSVGGIYSVRGFKNGTISGDSGYNIRNEFTLGMKKFSSLLQNFSLTPFYDYGYVRAKSGFESGRLSGAGFKIAFNHKYLNADLTYSRALSKSHLLGLQHYKDNDAIFFNVNSEFGF